MNYEIIFTPKEKIKGLILPKEITEDLAYFCGVLAGDGSIGFQEKKKDYWIRCVGNPKDEQEFYNSIIKPLIKKLFNLEIIPRHFDKGTTYGFNICSRSLVKYLTSEIGLPLGKKYDTLKIPPIFYSNRILVAKFIEGVADTDFHLRIRKKDYPVICGTSKSKNFIDEIKNFLEGEGFKIFYYVNSRFDTRVNKQVTTHRIEIYGRKQFLKWMNFIGFKHPKVSNKINILNCYAKTNSSDWI